jgi:phosphoribosylformylglycinamidine cyclo-ligase
MAASGAIRGIAHITGGGLTENLPRIFPKGCGAVITRGSWPVPPIFAVLQKLGSIPDDEMFRVFNMGIGLVLVVPSSASAEVMTRATELGERAYRIGEIREDTKSAAKERVSYVGT